MPSSMGSSWSRDWTRVSCIAGWFFTSGPPGKLSLVAGSRDKTAALILPSSGRPVSLKVEVGMCTSLSEKLLEGMPRAGKWEPESWVRTPWEINQVSIYLGTRISAINDKLSVAEYKNPSHDMEDLSWWKFFWMWKNASLVERKQGF